VGPQVPLYPRLPATSREYSPLRGHYSGARYNQTKHTTKPTLKRGLQMGPGGDSV
jgi:hypothetical protein